MAILRNTQITGSLNVTGGITGSLQGTSSWAATAVTSAYANTLNMAQSLIPAVARSYDIGSSTYSWYNIYGRLPRNSFRNPNGDNPYYFPEICNFLFAADRRFTVTRAGWNTGIGNDSTLFDGGYETYNTIDAGKTASIHIDLTSKGEYNSDGIVYSAGYFFICYYDVNYTTDSSGRVKDKNGVWTPISDISNVSPHSYYRIYRYTVPINNYLTEIYLDFTASATVRIVEMEYQLTRHGDQPSPYFDKSKNTKTYANIEFKDSSNSTTIGLNATNGTVTGSLFYGTSSRAISASYAPTGTGELPVGSTQQITSSWAITAKTASKVSVTPSEDSSDLNIVFHDGYANGTLYSDQNSFLRYNPIQAILYSDTFQASSGFIGNLTGTASWATNVVNGGSTTETYVTMALDGNNGITCSFNDTNEYVSVPTGALYTFTSSNAPTGTTVKELTLYIDNTAALTSSLSFPSTWLWIGAKPTYMTSSKSAVLQLKHFGGKKTIATFASEY